jgi:hypothetical protein
MTDKESGIPFKFKKGATIGEPDAESDERFLSECFTDTGDFQSLRDCSSPQRIIVGRTGAGKSALIQHLKQSEENVIDIPPENLALNFISNSDLLTTLEKAGVKLDIFYSLLWKHVFAVELIRAKYHLSNEEKTKSWVATFLSMLQRKDQGKERALTYLRDWGDKFWNETEYRVKEVTLKLENDIKASLGLNIDQLKTEISSGTKNSSERKIEVVHKAQSVVNSIQVKALSDVIRFLAEDVFNDPKQNYYIVIDKLDEHWVDDHLRYRLIRSLIETVKTFRAIPNVKIIVALRLDLLRSVFKNTRDSGFQEEKYQALFLPLLWNKEMLEQLLDKRMVKLVSEQYRTRPVKMRELFPDTILREKFIDYLLARTLYRPRDAIAFVNECLKQSDGRGVVRSKTVTQAEIEYSAQRVDSLCYEWIAHYPKLSDYLPLLEKMPAQFKLTSFTKEKIDDFCLNNCMQEGDNSNDPVITAGYLYLNGSSLHLFVIALFKAFFDVGILGIKPDSFKGQLWSFLDSRPPSDGQIKPSSEVFVHPMVWSRYGIHLKQSR